MQEFLFVLPIIIISWIMILGIIIGNSFDKKLKIPEKTCPPHKWNWENQPGMENTYFIKCQRCLMTPTEVSESN